MFDEKTFVGQLVTHHFTHSRFKSLVLAGAVLSLFFFIFWQINDLLVQQESIAHALSQIGIRMHEQASVRPASLTNISLYPLREDERRIPPKIWQIMLSKKHHLFEDDDPIDPMILQDTSTWLALNPGYAYTLVGEKSAEAFVKKHFADQPDVLRTYEELPNVGMKSDLLRYLILSIEGGVYTDNDTVALRPIDGWVPAQLGDDQVRLIVGVEFDRRDGGGWVDISHWVQFCQWTIAAAPDHPVFPLMIKRIMQALEEVSLDHGSPVNEVKPSSFEVVSTTGPAAWTDAVFDLLKRHDPTLVSTKNLSYMAEAKLFGDILVLPVDGFGMGQPHSHSTNDGTVPEQALVKHLFSGSWRGDEAG